MRIDSKTKRGWLLQVCRNLEPTFDQIGFKPFGKTAFVKREDKSSKSWQLNWRFPRFADDTHQVYVDPCIGISLPEVDRVVSLLTGKQIAKGLKTIGGTIGLFGSQHSLVDWPIDCEEDIPQVVAQFRKDIMSIAVPFWASIESPSKILNAIRSGSAFARMKADATVGLAVCGMVEGRAAALQFAEANFKMLRSQNRGWQLDSIRRQICAVFEV